MDRVNQALADPLVEETLSFVRSFFQVSGVVFGWIGQDPDFRPKTTIGVNPKMMDEYFSGMYRYDPLNIYQLIERKTKVAFLTESSTQSPENDKMIHNAFLNRFGIVDEADFIFWNDDQPVAVIGILKQTKDPPFRASSFECEAVRRYLEFNLGRHPYVYQQRRLKQLTEKFSLTKREIEIINLLKIGAKNAKIAYILGIKVPTVKTHIINILNKLGVENRMEITALFDAL